MDFTALDFETANHRRDSACQIGIAVVRGGKIVDRGCWLIRPEPLSFSSRNIEVHGIRPHQVQDQPTFGQLWPTLKPYLEGDCLIAHNASFDMGVLLGCIESHRCEMPTLQFSCTRLISRATWPGRSGYGLKPLSTWLGVRFQHHDALEDAIACAKVLLAAGIALDTQSLEELESKLRLQRGVIDADGYKPAGRVIRASSKRLATLGAKHSTTLRMAKSSDVLQEQVVHEQGVEYQTPRMDFQRLCVRAGFIRALQHQSVVCTGQFSSLSREEVERLIVSSGGTIAESVHAPVHLVVIGIPDQRTLESDRWMNHQEAAARELQASGHSLRLVTEKEFIEMIQCPVRQLS